MVCHQRPERSFHRHGAQYPVCARCLGLYVGAVIGIALWVMASGIGARPHLRAARMTSLQWKRTISFVAAPTILSVVTGVMGWWDGSNLFRAMLAVPLGAGIAALVAAVAAGDLR